MRVYRLVSICAWLIAGCGAGGHAPGLSATLADSGAQAPQADAGERPVDAGEADAPEPPRDAAQADEPYVRTDAGAQHDPNVSPIDAGAQPEQDPDVSPIDAGTPDDASVSPVDAAADAPDSAVTPMDSGTPEPTTPTDAGHSDAGTTPLSDAATPSNTDAGAQPDASTPPDAGSPSNTPDCAGPPGLYQDQKCQVLSAGIEAYQPQYPLWSDGAKKDRYIYLPAGTRIDTTNPNRWTFPVGTRLYKSFAAGDVKVETRVMEKVADGVGFDKWTLVSYAWSADQHSVSPANANGVVGALGTNLDIPSQANCKSCHNMTDTDAVIGFNALQLNHSLSGLSLSELLLRDLLVNNANPAQPNIRLNNTLIPGDATTRAGLGYLHGNCGHCHGGPSPRAGQALWSVVNMTNLDDAPLMQTAQCHCLDVWRGRTATDGQAYVLRVAPSHAAHSGIIGRMSSRVRGEQMPPIGTSSVDPTGLSAVRAFIDSLDGSSCDAAPPLCSN